VSFADIQDIAIHHPDPLIVIFADIIKIDQIGFMNLQEHLFWNLYLHIGQFSIKAVILSFGDNTDFSAVTLKIENLLPGNPNQTAMILIFKITDTFSCHPEDSIQYLKDFLSFQRLDQKIKRTVLKQLQGILLFR